VGGYWWPMKQKEEEFKGNNLNFSFFFEDLEKNDREREATRTGSVVAELLLYTGERVQSPNLTRFFGRLIQ